jgi:LytS/YehU family sensor histidine kinase
MSIRYDDSVDIKLNVQPNIPEVKIPPLLIQPFIENAFKHGISSLKSSFIHINLSIDNNYLICHVENSNNYKKENSGGIGLENIKKRLQLLYSNRYSLDIKVDDQIHSVILKIPTTI